MNYRATFNDNENYLCRNVHDKCIVSQIVQDKLGEYLSNWVLSLTIKKHT